MKERARDMKIVLDDGAYMPIKAHHADAGYDIKSPVCCEVYPGSSIVIDTGVHIQIPIGYVGFLKSKSGLNVNHGLVSEGVIDSGYTGSIKVKLYNHGIKPYTINNGDKISQIVFLPATTFDMEQVDSLEETERGDNGFGSTGR